MQKMQVEIQELDAKIAKLKSEADLNYAKIESEYGGQRKVVAGMVNDQRKLDQEDRKIDNQIELGRSQQSIGKAPNGLTDSTLKREYGLETNNQS